MPSSSSGKYHELSRVLKVNPGLVREQILDALRKSGMHKGRAAHRLHAAHSTFLTWIKKLALGADIAEMTALAIREGWHHGEVGGRTRGNVWSDEEAAARAGHREERKNEIREAFRKGRTLRAAAKLLGCSPTELDAKVKVFGMQEELGLAPRKKKRSAAA